MFGRGSKRREKTTNSFSEKFLSIFVLKKSVVVGPQRVFVDPECLQDHCMSPHGPQQRAFDAVDGLTMHPFSCYCRPQAAASCLCRARLVSSTQLSRSNEAGERPSVGRSPGPKVGFSPFPLPCRPAASPQANRTAPCLQLGPRASGRLHAS